MIFKRKRLIPIIILLVLCVLLAIGIKGLYSYVHRSLVLEAGIKISSFEAEDKKLLCSCFGVTAEEAITLNALGYREGLKNTNVRLQISVKDETQLKKVLLNYEESSINYSPIEIESYVSEQFELSKQYVNSKDEHIRVFVFTNQNEKILLFLSDRTNDSLKEFVDKQVEKGNYEPAF